MSLHWDGFQMKARTLDEALEVVNEFRPIASSMLHQWNAALLAAKAVKLIDRAHVHGQSYPVNPLAKVDYEISSQRLEIIRQEIRHPQVDPCFDLTLFRHEGSIYGLISTEQDSWRKAWLNRPEVMDFSWWNGTDRPDGLDQNEWARRDKAWKKMIPHSWPAETGIIIHLNPRYFSSRIEDVMEALPSLADRRRNMATEIATTRKMAENISQNKGPDALIAAAAIASCCIGTESGRAEIAAIEEKLDLPVITQEMLLKNDCEGRI